MNPKKNRPITIYDKFIQILIEEKEDVGNIMDIVYKNNKVYQRQYTYNNLKNEVESTSLIEKLSLDENYNKNIEFEIIEFSHKTQHIIYTIWLKKLVIEREIIKEIGQINFESSNII